MEAPGHMPSVSTPKSGTLAIHSSSPISFSVLHPPIILHCHHSLALARIGHAAHHFVNNTMTTNFVSFGGNCPTVNHEMQRVSQSYANLKDPAVNVTRFPYAPIAMAVTNDLLFGGRGLLTGLPLYIEVGSQACR